ncbi:MAG: AraC family transcriptional regulator ligand-binding domain-containing protein [Rubrivivax sp.]|nr:AraC family transcriptional regulator ligand-binding domain-containing protein [Rubrivivax sp.]
MGRTPSPASGALVRSASLTHFVEVAEQCGLDARALVAEAGLPARCLDDPDLKVPARSVGDLLERAALLGRESAFGLRMAQARRLSNLGPLALLVRDEPTLRDVLDTLLRYIHLHNEALAARLEQVGNLVVVRVELAAEGAGSLRQATELVLGVTFRVLGIFLGAGWRPRLVCFTHRAPASREVHRRLFGGAVEFGHAFNGIVCNASDLDARNPGADPVMARFAKRLLERDVRQAAAMADRVRQLVVLLLPLGYCRVEVVAQHLGVDRRTVARRLAAEGLTFSGLVDALRRDLVRRYLGERARPVADVSSLLGFSAPSAFARWHRQQFGAAASRHRRRAARAARSPR